MLLSPRRRTEQGTDRPRRVPLGLVEKNILITGLPGVGKTTLMRRLYEALKNFHPVGFYTAEIREGGVRNGFEFVDLDGKRGILSHVNIKSRYRVGRYKVDVSGFEDFLEGIPFLDPSSHMVMVDEIGKMECLSAQFNRMMKEALDSEKWVIATIALKGSGLIAEVKRRRDIELFKVMQSNRGILFSEILKRINP
jgi:nucleoside-triphosphatase